MNVFEFRNLLSSEDRKEKRKGFLKSLIKSVDTGANGTQDYIVKKGTGKNLSLIHISEPTRPRHI